MTQPQQQSVKGKRIGLLGGSFNPAHEGHVHISLEAINRLNLDKVWWVVSPQNPLKSTEGMDSFDNRYKGACDEAKPHADILVSDVEQKIGTTKTIDTLKKLTATMPETQFVWLMGADNMEQFHKWASWEDIISLVPIAILDREEYTTKALQGKFATSYAHLRVEAENAKNLGSELHDGLGWVYLNIPTHPQSSTKIRQQQAQR